MHSAQDDTVAIDLTTSHFYLTTMFTSLPGTTPEQVRGRLNLTPA